MDTVRNIIAFALCQALASDMGMTADHAWKTKRTGFDRQADAVLKRLAAAGHVLTPGGHIDAKTVVDEIAQGLCAAMANKLGLDVAEVWPGLKPEYRRQAVLVADHLSGEGIGVGQPAP